MRNEERLGHVANGYVVASLIILWVRKMPIFFAEMESGTLIHFKINITYPVSLLVVVCHNHLYNKFGFNQSL